MKDARLYSKMELLAPAGNLEAFWAAIAAGADAVYLGGPVHNARLGSENFSLDDMARAMEIARVRGKKVYITVNTLIDRAEFQELNKYLEKLQQLQVNAIIVQDLGLLSIVRRDFPGLRVHASTQMFIHNRAGLDFLASHGVRRAVLPRELSLDEIRMVNASSPEVESEIFVHGALCYSFSGNCLFSSMVGGRSANRGRCAQPCRLAYRLLADQQSVTEGKGRHVLSMADLCAIDLLGDLQMAGVSALKIEGRMKRPEYVAVATRCYRQALDWLAKEEEPFDSDQARREMARVFNRRFTSAYLDGSRRQLISAHRPNNRGVFTGRVLECSTGAENLETAIKLSEPVNEGDGLVIWTQGKPVAFNVGSFLVDGKENTKSRPGELIRLPLRQRVQANDRVFKTYDRELMESARRMIEEEKQRRIGVRVRLVFTEGSPLLMRLADANGHHAEASSLKLLVKAQKTSLPPEIIADKVGKTGNTPFEMVELRLDGDMDLFIPLSDLNETRRRAFDALLASYFEKPSDEGSLDQDIAGPADPAELMQERPALKESRGNLSVMTANPDQARAAIENGASRVYLAVAGPGGYRLNESDFGKLSRLASKYGTDFCLSMPWFAPAGNGQIMKKWAEQGASSFLLGNLGDIWSAASSGYRYGCDLNLNVFNPRALEVLTGLQAMTVCLSPELNTAQILSFHDLSRAEVIIHGELAVMVSRCCILKDDLPREQHQCRGVCRQSSYSLQDQKGYRFPVEFDGNCNQYIFNSRTLCAVEDLPRLKDNMPAWLRIEGSRCTAAQIEGLLALWHKYAGLVMSRPDIPGSIAEDYRSRMQAFSNMPLTRGHWHRGVRGK